MPFPSRNRERGRIDNRKRSRSFSPAEQKPKRSWQSSSHDRSQYHRSPPPKKKDFKPPQRFGRYSPSSSRKSRSRSPKPQKRSFGNVEGSLRYSSKEEGRHRSSPHRGEKSEHGSRAEPRARKRSLSSRSPSKDDYDNRRASGPEFGKSKHLSRSRSPEEGKYHVQSSKKKASRASPTPALKRPPQARSVSPASPPTKKKAPSHDRPVKEGSIPQRKVGPSGKKKSSHITLHARFAEDDIGPFRLHSQDNVTIAILRNPRAQPSEDVTVQQIFDSSLFKMVHHKSTGRKPIFDREEIKVWRHDENLDDDPDFEERRLVRVKSVPKKATDSLMRMSPDVLRKTFGLDINEKSPSRSQRSPNVRLNPKPDSRYESRYQQQLKDEVEGTKRRRDGGRKDEEEDRSHSRGEERHRYRDDDRYGGGDDYDLRQALERRRVGKDDDYDQGKERYSDSRRHLDDDRNVVVEHERGWTRDGKYGDKFRRGGWDRGARRRSWIRGRGRGPRRPWSPRRGDREDMIESKDRGYDRREQFSPVNTRGRGGGFRARGRGKTFIHYQEEKGSPPADDYYKYAQHDDRDVSPKSFQGRGRSNRFVSRGFRGSRGFRPGRRGRGFRSTGRGRGFYRQDDSRNFEKDDRRSIEHSSEREWKHDMYDSVQSDEEELPHSTTATT